MCIMCVEILKGKMTIREVGRALGEFTVTPEHKKELEQVILKHFSSDDIVKNTNMDIEEVAEAFGEIDFRQFGDVEQF